MTQGILFTIILLVTIVLTAYVSYAPSPDLEFWKYLQNRDPNVYNSSKSGVYYTARLLPDQSSLHKDTDFRADLISAQVSFDLYANTAGYVLRTFNSEIEDLIKRGVNLRILLSDFELPTDNFDIFARSVKEDPDGSRKEVLHSKQVLDEILSRANHDRGTYRGTIEVRYTKELLLYTTWIRDRNTPNAIAHLGVHFHGGKDKCPSLRAGRDSGNLIQNITTEFDNIWGKAKSY